MHKILLFLALWTFAHADEVPLICSYAISGDRLVVDLRNRSNNGIVLLGLEDDLRELEVISGKKKISPLRKASQSMERIGDWLFIGKANPDGVDNALSHKVRIFKLNNLYRSFPSLNNDDVLEVKLKYRSILEGDEEYMKLGPEKSVRISFSALAAKENATDSSQ